MIAIDTGPIVAFFDKDDKYHDLPIDLADATLVAISEEIGISTVFTLDHKDFSIFKPKHIKRFTLLPAKIK